MELAPPTGSVKDLLYLVQFLVKTEGGGWVVGPPSRRGKYSKMALEMTVGFHSIEQSICRKVPFSLLIHAIATQKRGYGCKIQLPSDSRRWVMVVIFGTRQGS